MAPLTSTGRIAVTAVILAVVIGGYFGVQKFHKTAPVVPATTQEAVQTPAPKVQEEVKQEAPAAVAAPAEAKAVEVVPVKKHTAGHVAKHVQEKHQVHTKSTPHHSSSTPTHSTETVEHNALQDLANDK